jgi:hypothetical protein
VTQNFLQRENVAATLNKVTSKTMPQRMTSPPLGQIHTGTKQPKAIQTVGIEGSMKNIFIVFAFLASSAALAIEPTTYDYRIHEAKFDSIFIPHPKCAPAHMEWSQMDCSNFKARASKRFSAEWVAHSYWDGYHVINNADADKRVNAELTGR